MIAFQGGVVAGVVSLGVFPIGGGSVVPGTFVATNDGRMVVTNDGKHLLP